ncbi:MAG TPA: hypothetical protein VFB60_22010 [Ktedonobacteraceae bacterium]|nr:hypothetical protein [Ktedonobacteraceae bacterium]
MSEKWLQQYILLAFHIDKVVRAAYECPFVEAYYGPPAWESQAEAEPVMAPADLVRQSMALADTLPLQGFPSQRATYLGKHVKAMETLCRKLSGEPLSLAEGARYCLDIQPAWTPEEQFEQAHALYESVLPGTGNLAERWQTYRASLAFPSDQPDALIDFIKQAYAEARKRTKAFIDLPEEETIEIEYRAEWEHDAAAYYEGNYRTHIVMNVASTGAYLSRLFDHKVCHEGYPGHHTDYILKEQLLYRQQGYVEHAINLTLCPQRVIEEGIAQMAHAMIFAEGEAEQWIAEHVYRTIQKEVDPIVLLRLRQASEMLGGVWDNAAMLLDEGRSEREVNQYLTTHILLAPDQAAQMVTHLKHPIWGRNELTYLSGKKLMQPWLQGADKLAVFRRFLTEQITPSQLIGGKRDKATWKQ